MRQIWISRKGGPEVLELREAPDPPPQAGQVRIRVRAAGVNFAETLARLGLYPDAPRLPFVPGYEVAGEVDAVGPGAHGARVGQRVLALTRFGGYSDVVCVPQEQAEPLPDGLSFAQGASLPVNWLTAWHLVVNLGNLRPGQRVLVHAAAGGVGTAAVQIARRLGAEVFGTASASKHARLRELGLHHAIDYRTEDFEEEVRRATSGKGVHLVLDAVGGASFRKGYRLLSPTGRLVMFGASALASDGKRSLPRAIATLLRMPPFWPLALLNDNKGVFGVNLGRLWDEAEMLQGYLREVLAGVTRGELRPIIDSEIPFAQAARAHERLRDRENFGKVLLVP
ncbi:MAG: medium chain dehydrogenase/reductase family protein [Myxococcales bacterium]